jgi:hypothetical protein
MGMASHVAEAAHVQVYTMTMQHLGIQYMQVSFYAVVQMACLISKGRAKGRSN